MKKNRTRDASANLWQRLHEAARKVTDKFHASGFSISVGFPFGVSVSVDW
jgi:hypothetical protein